MSTLQTVRVDHSLLSLPQVMLRVGLLLLILILSACRPQGSDLPLSTSYPLPEVTPLTPDDVPQLATPIPSLSSALLPLSPGWVWYQSQYAGYRIAYPQSWNRYRDWGPNTQPGAIQERVRFQSVETNSEVIVDVWSTPSQPDFDFLAWINARPEGILFTKLDKPVSYNAAIMGLPAVFHYQPATGGTGDIAILLFTNGVHRFRVFFNSSVIPRVEAELSVYRAMLESFALDNVSSGELSIPSDWGRSVEATVGITPVATEQTTIDSIQANGSSGDPTGLPPGISADGRWVVYASRASNLVPGDTNKCESRWASEPSDGNCLDVFVRDLETGTTKRVSVASDGTQANGESFAPVISADGRWVAFRSRASNLAPNFSEECARRDRPRECSGIFVHDLHTGQTELLVVVSGHEGLGVSDYLGISADASLVTFWSYEAGLLEGPLTSQGNFFIIDRQTREIRLAVVGDGAGVCRSSGASTDYRWTSNLYPGGDIFVPDPQTGEVDVANASDSTFSADGRYRVFASEASDLVSGDTHECDHPQFGRHNCADIFVCDRETEHIERVSVASDGTQSDSDSHSPGITADGRFVVFASDASNLVPDDTNACKPNPYTFSCSDIFVHDRETGITERVSVASDGTQANGDSRWPRISADGRWVVFVSRASNLVAGDTNELPDVFVHDRLTGKTERVSVPSLK